MLKGVFLYPNWKTKKNERRGQKPMRKWIFLWPNVIFRVGVESVYSRYSIFSYLASVESSKACLDIADHLVVEDFWVLRFQLADKAWPAIALRADGWDRALSPCNCLFSALWNLPLWIKKKEMVKKNRRELINIVYSLPNVRPCKS